MLLDPYQSRFIMNTIVNINPDTIQSVFAGVLKIQLNQELKAHTKNIVNINPDTTQPVFSGICLT